MKGGGAGDKAGKGGGMGRPLRLESQRFRLLSIVVGCFVICLVFLLSSRPDVTAFDTMSSKASLMAARRPAAVKTLLRTTTASSSSSGTGDFGADFHVDILPQRRHQEQQSLQRTAGDKTATEWIRDTVIVEERSEAESSEAETEETVPGRDDDANATDAAASNSDEDHPAAHDAEKEVQDDDTAATAAVITGQPGVETTSTAPHRPEEKTGAATATGGGGQSQSKLQEQPEPARPRQAEEEERHAEPARQSAGVDHHHQHQQPPPQPPLCDFSDFRSDICDLAAGDVRIDTNTSTILVVDPRRQRQEVHKVRPYPRKGDETCMSRIMELTVRATTTTDATPPPRCTVTHSDPAVVFSIGGYTGNIFHDFSDVLVPLYNTAQRYRGDVHLVMLMAKIDSWWLVKYARLLRALSRHAPIDLAAAGARGEVHCFPRGATVSLRAHKELIIERDRSLDGLATPDFTRFLRAALSLPRDAPTATLLDRKRPRLLIISRHRTRLLLNLGEVVRAAEEAGFEAVVNESDVGNDIAQVGGLINSCDAMVGVHGAGLTNMMFLPPGAALVQIVPWGGLQWMARADYGDPAEAMGLKYVQYEIGVHESTLKDKFPKGHKIFTNPTALHKKGFMFIRQTLMDGQDITVDVVRFREVLIQVLNSLAQ